MGIENGRSDCEGREIPEGEICTFTCDAGYKQSTVHPEVKCVRGQYSVMQFNVPPPYYVEIFEEIKR